MRTNKSKSFSLFEDIPFEETYSNSSEFGKGMRKGQQANEITLITLSELLRKLLLLLNKPFVALKYLFFKKTQVSPQSIRLPWFKLAFVALVAFIIFKKDLSFSVGMNSPETIAAHDEQNNLSMNSLATAQTVSLNAKKVHPFADAAGDSGKDKKIKSYIRRFQKVAVTEMEKFGIPASVKMAQAIVESNAGNSRLSREFNNHFGIKCFSKQCSKGHCANFSDDHHKDFFRNYDSAWESWRAHSHMLVNGRYQKLLNHEKDYRAWAKGLKKLGYATDKAYTEKLIATIERYQLDLLDAM